MAKVSPRKDVPINQPNEAQFLTSCLAAGALFSSYVSAVTPLVVEGADFINSVDGARFQVLGVA
jgi:hypothetical protein